MYFQYRKDNRNEWRWWLRAANNEVIAVSSEGYKNESDCKHSIDLVKSSHSAPVYKVA